MGHGLQYASPVPYLCFKQSLCFPVQSYVAELLPTNSTDPSALTLAALQGATVVQINSSAAVLALARSAGFDSVNALMPGLQMFWDDVSNCYP
jgi:hypothetical protein